MKTMDFKNMPRLSKLLIGLFVAYILVLVGYDIAWPAIQMDDIPHPSCTEMTSEKYRTRSVERRPKEIMVAIDLTDRIGYTTFTASVIKAYHNIPDIDIHVYSQRIQDYDKPSLHSMYGNQAKILSRQQSRTMHVLNIFARSNYKILFLIDSEMIFMPDWRQFLTEHMIRNNRQFVSIYHSATLHSFEKDCENVQGDVCTGVISSKSGVALSKDFAKKLISSYPDLINRNEWNTILQKENIPGIYPAKSLAIKIGQTNQDEEFCGENEVPYGFRLCELPCWVRNGIEFYFDQCTNPQEKYSPDLSAMRASIQRRKWTRPVVVYTLYGNKSKYVNGGLVNAKRLFTIYPGWKIWIYIDNTVSPDVVRELCSYNVKFLNMTGTHIRNKMSWRFLIAAEPVKYFTILDIDYRLLARGREATEDWLKSGRTFHIMRDHPNHSKYPFNGQMWGGYGNSITNMKQLIADYRGNDVYMTDIHFLTRKVWPIVKQSAWVHDAYSLHIYGEDHPFPTKRKGGEFVGNVDFN